MGEAADHPRHYLYAGITVSSALGAYAISSSVLDLRLLLALGLVGFTMRRYDVLLALVLIAVILGPMAETGLRRALAVSEGDFGILVAGPITLFPVLAVALVVAAVQHPRRSRNRAEVGIEESASA